MRKSRGEKVLGRREGRVRGRFEGARVQKSFFAAADIRGWKLVFYACLSNEFRAFSEQCHATLSIGRDASSLSTMIDRRLSWKRKQRVSTYVYVREQIFFLKSFSFLFPHQSFQYSLSELRCSLVEFLFIYPSDESSQTRGFSRFLKSS